MTIFLAARARGAPAGLLLDSTNLAGAILSPQAMAQIGIAPTDENSGAAQSGTVEVPGMPTQVEPITVGDLIYDADLGAAFMQRGSVMFDLRGKLPRVGMQPTR